MKISFCKAQLHVRWKDGKQLNNQRDHLKIGMLALWN